MTGAGAHDGVRPGLSAHQLHTVAVLGFCGLVSAADNWFVSPALPSIAAALAVAPAAASVILTAYLLPYGALQPVCGRIGDGVGRLRLLRVIVLGLAAGTLLCAAAPSLPMLVGARIVTGCFAAGIISVSQAFVGDEVDVDRRGGAVGLLMGITFTGQGLSAGLGGVLTDVIGWRAAFAAFGVLAIAAWAGLFTLREPACQGSARSAAGGSAVRSFARDAVRLFCGPRRAVFLLACGTGLLFLGVYGLMGTFLAEVCALDSTHAGLLMMFYGVFCLVGGALSGRIGSGGLARVVAVGEVSGILSALSLVLSTLTASWVPALAAAALLGLGYILVQPSLVTLSMEADPGQAGLCTGLVGFAVFACGGAGSALGGALLSGGGYLLLWGAVLCGLVIQLAVSRRVL